MPFSDWLIGDFELAKANETLDAICKDMIQKCRVGPVLHRKTITSEQMKELLRRVQIGDLGTNDPSQLQHCERPCVT